MEWIFEASAWISLLTLVILEIVLGIDNLVFIAILANKLPEHQRAKARTIGLGLALLIRLVLLSAISWVMTLTRPLFSLGPEALEISGRDIIFIVGGLFLLFKGTFELHERLEAKPHGLNGNGRVVASFGMVVTQIVLLDAVFSLDSVITAVGMAHYLGVMMTAVIIAMGVMLWASKPLTEFVGHHPTVVVLCLSFLLMIGFSLVIEGFGFHVPKGYLYAAIGFSIIIESFNQVAQRNTMKHERRKSIRMRAVEAIAGLMDSQREPGAHNQSVETAHNIEEAEKQIIGGVLNLADRPLKSLMTPRTKIAWINCEASPEEIKKAILDSPHSLLPVCRGQRDEVIGVARAKDLLRAVMENNSLENFKLLKKPIIVPESMSVIAVFGVLKRAHGQLVLVADEFGSIAGLITPVDLLEILAGEFPDEDETFNLTPLENGWLAKGEVDMYLLEQTLGVGGLVSQEADYTILSGFLLTQLGHLPKVGETLVYDDLKFEVLEVANRRVESVKIEFLRNEADEKENDLK